MSKAAMNLQDSFLNQVRRENSEVRVLLVNGTLLRGTVKGFDNFTLILNNRNGQHLIYKHAVAQIVTHRPHGKGEDFTHPELDNHGEVENAAEKLEHAEVGAAKSSDAAPGRSADTGSGRSEHAHSKAGEREHSGGGRHSQGGGSQESGNRSKPKKEGFNKLDLSQVKLGESEKR